MTTTTTNKTENTATPSKAKPICKLGLDCHAKSIMVARQIEGLQPQPPQKFTPAKFIEWVKAQSQAGYQIYSCYEAGPTGYGLHRQLTELGVTNYVVCPTRLDSRGKGVNTDKTDATELLVRLDRYVAGNTKAFSVVRVPTLAQEQRRAQSRQREQLRKHRLSLAAQGRMLLLNQGISQSNQWWQARPWARLTEQLPEWLRQALECFRRLIEGLNQELARLTGEIASAAPALLPKGLGALSHEVLEREIRDWHRFENRRQVGSYSGLTGGISGSGEHSADLSITKAGNRRLRSCLVESAWRMVFHQPDYWLVKKWRDVLSNPKAHLRRRKKAIVAFARELLIDLWKWKTGRATAQELGWRMT